MEGISQRRRFFSLANALSRADSNRTDSARHDARCNNAISNQAFRDLIVPNQLAQLRRDGCGLRRKEDNLRDGHCARWTRRRISWNLGLLRIGSTRAEAEVGIEAFAAEYDAKYPKAVASLQRDRRSS
jgi:hypothetical protein